MSKVFDIEPHEYIRGELLEHHFADSTSSIFYCKIDHVLHFLDTVGGYIKSPFVLVTHNGDLPVSQQLVDYAKSVPFLKKWFGQNINCNPDSLVHSIPIGLENDYNFPELQKRRKLRDKVVQEAATPTIPSRLLYLNYSFSTNRIEREYAWKASKANLKKETITDKCVDSISQSEYISWLDDVAHHHYVLCPKGNGLDTHRLWETLYLGRIPIVKIDTNNTYYEQLPILFVNDWSEVTEHLLRENINRFSITENFNIETLKFSWWKEKIATTLKDLS